VAGVASNKERNRRQTARHPAYASCWLHLTHLSSFFRFALRLFVGMTGDRLARLRSRRAAFSANQLMVSGKTISRRHGAPSIPLRCLPAVETIRLWTRAWLVYVRWATASAFRTVALQLHGRAAVLYLTGWRSDGYRRTLAYWFTGLVLTLPVYLPLRRAPADRAAFAAMPDCAGWMCRIHHHSTGRLTVGCMLMGGYWIRCLTPAVG